MNPWQIFQMSGAFGWCVVSATLFIVIRAAVAIARDELPRRFGWLALVSVIPLLLGFVGVFVGNSTLDRAASAARSSSATVNIAAGTPEIAYPLYLGIAGTVIAAGISGVGLLRSAGRHGDKRR